METEKQIILKQIPKEEAKLHAKNPKRVAQGKKLAEISREAKARARKRDEQQKEQPSEDLQLPNLTTTISLVSVLTAVIGTYIAWKKFKKEEVNNHPSPDKPAFVVPSPVSNLTKSKTKYNNLDNEDI